MLLAANPNYFGNLPNAPFKPVFPIATSTRYEELTCVAYSQARGLLEATVQVKLPTGYGGNLCQAGSREYVRFYVDTGGGWFDVGVVGIEVHDIPDGSDCAGQAQLPLTYAAAAPYEPKRRPCFLPFLPRVRAILSWSVVPPAGQPNWVPVWGNVRECTIQIPSGWWTLTEFAKSLADHLGVTKPVTLPPFYQGVPDLPFPVPEPDPLPFSAVAELYRHGGRASQELAVPAHRFGYAEIHAALQPGEGSQTAILAANASWSGLGLDWVGSVTAATQTTADTTYEELECLGLDNNVDRLAAIFRIKRSSGYSGGPCTAGSKEYIAFWADWDNTCQWTHLATIEVGVHDFAPLPADGLCYSALLPVDLANARQRCDRPKLARVRAVLSWNAAPSTTDPDALTTWGNRVDAHVQIRPGPPSGAPAATIGVLGGIPVSMINSVSGLTTPQAIFALNQMKPDAAGRPCPFGGRVVVQGPSFPGFKYRVQVKRVGDPVWTPLVTPLTLVDWTGTVFTSSAPDASGYFTYVPFTQNVDNVLAVWDTTGDDLWEVGLDILSVAGIDVHRVQLDNTGPQVAIAITGGGGNCGKFAVGAILQGTFVARDLYLGSYSLGTSPFAGPVVPGGGAVSTPPAPGSTWTLATGAMQPCGYVVSVSAVDRAILNSGAVGHWASASAGFCLE